ncbi:hypothetical protein AAG747_29085 [Rapidithrix thailandica]|uniref:Thioredoxin domain-containing protein n=1 Tax=Rapidithrix thailandica TaxID=413964 RepID=A0AAW9SJP4_9BACT
MIIDFSGQNQRSVSIKSKLFTTQTKLKLRATRPQPVFSKAVINNEMEKRKKTRKRIISWLFILAFMIINASFYPNLWKSHYYKWTDFEPNIKVHSGNELGVKNYHDLHSYFKNDKPTLVWLNTTSRVDILEKDSSYIRQLQKLNNLNIVFTAHALEENEDLKNKWFVEVKENGFTGDYVSLDDHFNGYHGLFKTEKIEGGSRRHRPYYLLINKVGTITDTIYNSFSEEEKFYKKLKEIDNTVYSK